MEARREESCQDVNTPRKHMEKENMVGDETSNGNNNQGTAQQTGVNGVAADAGTLPASTPAKPPRLRPALRGILKRDPNGTVKWEGTWGLDDSAFDGGITSAFSYSRTRTSGEQNNLEVALEGEPEGSDILEDGFFSGYFNIVVSGKSKKIPEKNLSLQFRLNNDEDSSSSSIKVNGSGSNQYGGYVLEGTLVLKTGELNIYREYTGQPPAPVARNRGTKKPQPPKPKKTAQVTPSTTNTTAPALTAAAPATASVPKVTAPKEITSQDLLSAPARNQRMRRAPSHLVDDLLDEREAEDLIKLKNIVREVLRADREGWFAAPVDAEALGLRNYHDVIKNPMDLGTILKKFEQKEYHTQDEASEDVRLTFNNAMTYNAPGTGVHVAAKKLLSMFESQLQKMSNNRAQKTKKRKKSSAAVSGSGSSVTGSTGKRSKSSKPTEAKTSMSDVFGSSDEEDNDADDGDDGMESSDNEVPVKRKKARNSQGASSKAPELANEEVLGLREQIEMMQRQIEQMSQLHASMQQGVLAQPLQNQQIHVPPAKSAPKPRRSSEPRPLSYQEKRQLGQDINKLPPEMIEGVIKIMEESGTVIGDEDGEVELDIEALDTPALKKLQKYVKKCLGKVRAQQARGEDVF